VDLRAPFVEQQVFEFRDAVVELLAAMKWPSTRCRPARRTPRPAVVDSWSVSLVIRRSSTRGLRVRSPSADADRRTASLRVIARRGPVVQRRQIGVEAQPPLDNLAGHVTQPPVARVA
jgi:hypothetical protein